MKKLFIFLMLTMSLALTAQTTPSYKTIKLTNVPEDSGTDSVLVLGSDGIVKYVKKSDLLPEPSIPTTLQSVLNVSPIATLNDSISIDTPYIFNVDESYVSTGEDYIESESTEKKGSFDIKNGESPIISQTRKNTYFYSENGVTLGNTITESTFKSYISGGLVIENTNKYNDIHNDTITSNLSKTIYGINTITRYKEDGTNCNYNLPDSGGTFAVKESIGVNIINEGNGTGLILSSKNLSYAGNAGLNSVDFGNYGYSNPVNFLRGATGTNSFIGSGFNNMASNTYSNILGGAYNISSGEGASIGGGFGNIVSHQYTHIGGGFGNIVNGQYSAILGGANNTNDGTLSYIIGGQYNNINENGTSAVISGGGSNTVTGNGSYSSISGGSNNTSTYYSSISGGADNTTTGWFSTVSGGKGNTAVSFGEWVGGMYGTIPSVSTGVSAWEAQDRIFNVGNGTDNSNRSNALTILKNGTITAPSLDISEINSGGNKSLVTKEYVDQKVANSKPYKVYTALLSQGDVNNPSAIVLDNEFTAPVVWTRSGAGIYIGTLTGAFAFNKTVTILSSSNAYGSYESYRLDDDTVQIITHTDSTHVGVDEYLQKTPFEIRVYN